MGEDQRLASLPILKFKPGTNWYRIHHKLVASFATRKEALNRFDDPAKNYEVLYLSENIEGAFLETLGRNLNNNFITTDQLDKRIVSITTINTTISLIDLTGEALRLLGQDAQVLTTTDYNIPQNYSQLIYQNLPNIGGIYYRSRLNPSIKSIALFDRQLTNLKLIQQNHLLPLSPEVIAVIDKYQFALLIS